MYCTNCGKKNTDNSMFCIECGTKLVPTTNALTNIENRKAQVFNNNINIAPSANFSSYNKPEKKIHFFPAILVLVFVIVIGLVGALGASNIFASKNGKRTIMIYMVGSNLESEYGAATSDLLEMSESGADFSNINLIVYTGGAKTWRTSAISNDENAIYEVNASGITKVSTYTKTKMGDSNTLLTFLNYAYDNYRAENYSLIFWDHGGGPIYGFGLDEYNSRDSLSINEIKAALGSSPFKNNQLDFIGFDACLMSSIETANALKDYTSYMIASEENEPGSGWNYKFLGHIKKDSTPKEIGMLIVDYYYSFYTDYGTNGITISLLDLNKVKDVEDSLNNLFSSIDGNLILDFSNISRTRNNSKTFGKSYSTSYDLVDLYDLADNMPSKYNELSKMLENSITEFVIYHKTDIDGAHGVSIYFPYDNKKSAVQAVSIFNTFNFAKNYYEFIKDFVSTLTGNRMYSWDTRNIMPLSKTDGSFEIVIPEDIKENYSKATYVIFEKSGEYYTPRFQGTDVTLEGNVLSTNIKNKGIVATDKEGNSIYLMAFEAEKGNNYTKYLLPGIVQNFTEDDTFSNSIPVFVHFVVSDDNPNGKIEGVTETNPDTELSSKTIIDVSNYKSISFLGSSLYKIFNEDGTYNPSWESDSNLDVEMLTSTISDIKIEFIDLNTSKEYYGVFIIQDSQGNKYSTNVSNINL